MNRIILAGFDGKDNPARIITQSAEVSCRRIIIPNDRENSAKLLLDEIQRAETSAVILLGQKPCIADKIAVEPVARRGAETLHTRMDVTVCAEILKANGFEAYISRGCGTSLCNHIYFECLSRGICCVFLHVPTLNNITDISAAARAVSGLVNNIAGVPCML